MDLGQVPGSPGVLQPRWGINNLAALGVVLAALGVVLLGASTLTPGTSRTASAVYGLMITGGAVVTWRLGRRGRCRDDRRARADGLSGVAHVVGSRRVFAYAAPRDARGRGRQRFGMYELLLDVVPDHSGPYRLRVHRDLFDGDPVLQPGTRRGVRIRAEDPRCIAFLS